MTYEIPADSPKAAKAAAFGRELQKACLARDISLKELGRTLNVGHTTLWHYRFGRTLPKVAAATALAVALDWPKLRELVVKARTRTCARQGCGATFVNDVGSEARKFCTPMCGKVATNLRQAELRARSAGQTQSPQTRRAHVQRLRAAVRIADERTAVHARAIAEMCGGCEPEGLCRTPECPLRDVSPLPLANRPDVSPRTVTQTRRASWTPERRERFDTALRERWARPGERERQSKRTRAMHEAMSPEEHEAWRTKDRGGEASVVTQGRLTSNVGSVSAAARAGGPCPRRQHPYACSARRTVKGHFSTVRAHVANGFPRTGGRTSFISPSRDKKKRSYPRVVTPVRRRSAAVSLRPMSALRTHDSAREQVQREHELTEALSAARHLQSRLEMLGGHDEAVRSVRGIRDDLATHLVVSDDTHDSQNLIVDESGG